ncbi:MAG: hypothetical protein ACXWYD_14535, partial [Candidatus Binatia bacterium]
MGIALLIAFNTAFAAQTKPAWQAEWERILEAAKKEGQLSIYISGYEDSGERDLDSPEQRSDSQQSV